MRSKEHLIINNPDISKMKRGIQELILCLLYQNLNEIPWGLNLLELATLEGIYNMTYKSGSTNNKEANK